MSEDIHELRAGLRRMGEQQTNDFQFMAMALKETGQHFQSTLETLGREMAERFNQIEGRMRLSEQRLGLMLQAIDNGLSNHEDRLEEWKPEMIDLKRRVEALESRIDPAA